MPTLYMQQTVRYYEESMVLDKSHCWKDKSFCWKQGEVLWSVSWSVTNIHRNHCNTTGKKNATRYCGNIRDKRPDKD